MNTDIDQSSGLSASMMAPSRRGLFGAFALAAVATQVAAPALAAVAKKPLRMSDVIDMAVKDAHERYLGLNEGANADYIPALAKVPSKFFGISLVSRDGKAHEAGDTRELFSIQSICKVFNAAIVMQESGAQFLVDSVGVEAGLVVILHNDVDAPFAKGDSLPNSVIQMRDVLLRHPKTTIIWAHTGLGRIVKPVQPTAGAAPGDRSLTPLDIMERLLENPALSHVYLDISWDEVAKYAVASPESIQRTAAFINRHPDRILFGTDNVAPKDQATQLRVFDLWKPVFDMLTPEASHAVRIDNYNRLFDRARIRVRAWEKANVTTAKAAQ